MLESVGSVSYVIRKLNQVRENVSSSQSRFEAIEIIEAVTSSMARQKRRNSSNGAFVTNIAPHLRPG
jgi:hypothetical protein